MTVAIKRRNNDLIFLDAVMQFSRQYRGTVSKNPIEDGSHVTDHVTTENPIITINGVVSDADFNTDRPIISDTDARTYDIKSFSFKNDKPVEFTPIIGGNVANRLLQYLPQSVTQFIGDVPPSIFYVDTEDRTSDQIVTRMTYIVESILLEIFNKKEEVVLLAFENNIVTGAYSDYILTNLIFEETVEGGLALYPQMTFENIKKARLRRTVIPKKVVDSVNAQAKTEEKKGREDTKTGAKTTEAGEDAKNEQTSGLHRGVYGRSQSTSATNAGFGLDAIIKKTNGDLINTEALN